VGEARVGGDDGVAQRLHDLGFDVVGEVAAVHAAGHVAPAVGDLLLLGERVVDAGEELDVGLEHAGKRARGGFAAGAVLVGEKVERGFEVEVFGPSGPGTSKPSAAMVSSKRRFQAAAPTVDWSWRKRSSSSESWCGFIARMRSKTGL
jgi:hypothetical protein